MSGYSEDLRVKVVEYLKKGHTIKETAETFGVSMRAISIWKKMVKDWYLSLFRGARIE